MMTDAELDEIAAIHEGDTRGPDFPPFCGACEGDRWPCATTRLVEEVRRLRAESSYQAGYRDGADNEWASIEAVADEFGDDELLAYIKRRLVADGWVSE